MKYTPANIKMWARMGQRGAVFGIALPDIAAGKERVKLLTADLALLSGMERYVKKYPDKFLNVGIAEQNMIGIAAGLAMEGYCVFASTYASFIAVRSLEQVRQNLAHMGCNVKLIGSSAVIATGLMVSEALKATAMLEERGISCALYNMHTIKPVDKEGLSEIFARHSLVVTVEEHMVTGGMGSAVAEYKSTLSNGPRQVFLGFQNTFCQAGSQRYVWEQAGLTDTQLAERIAQEWEKEA